MGKRSAEPCSVADCEQPVFIHKRVLCRHHYYVWYQGQPKGSVKRTRPKPVREFRSCGFCGEPTTRRRWCSNECGAAARARSLRPFRMLPCRVCGVPFKTRSNGARYCSPACRLVAVERRKGELRDQRTRPCLGCGRDFVHHPDPTQRFCSLDCYNLNRPGRGGLHWRRQHPGYDHAYRKLRVEILREHRAVIGDVCPGLDGRRHHSEHLTIDHIVPLLEGGTNDRINLRVLCLYCNIARADLG